MSLLQYIFVCSSFHVFVLFVHLFLGFVAFLFIQSLIVHSRLLMQVGALSSDILVIANSATEDYAQVLAHHVMLE